MHQLDVLKQLHIIPVSISYELDPCDFLKAKEFQLKRDNPAHKKSQTDDIENMLTGIMGFKGRVRFRFGKCINTLINRLPGDIPRNELLEKVACIIDREIYSNYSFFPFNYVAYDRMSHHEHPGCRCRLRRLSLSNLPDQSGNGWRQDPSSQFAAFDVV